MADLTETLAERGARYGKFEHHAVIAQGLKAQMWAADGWVRLAPDQRQALEVIQDKVARILNGDPDYTDNWHDIAGYSRLVEDRLNEREAAPTPLYERAVAGLARPRMAGEQIAPEPGWIKWTGGECPVPQGTLVDVRHKDGGVYRRALAALYKDGKEIGRAYDWRADIGPGTIVAYRLSPKQD